MAISDLFTGIAVVIDDEVGIKSANITILMQQLDDKKIPYKTYNMLPPIDTVKHFSNISFILLDWKLNAPELAQATFERVRIPDALSEATIRANIELLTKLKEDCFAPVFIFTNENPDTVITELRDKGLYHDVKPNFIFVKSKRDLIDGKMFDEIEAWIKKSPSIYVLKEWEKEYGKAKGRLFRDFYNLSPAWPKILWDNFSTDGVNMSRELGEVITRNLHTRMAPFEFDGSFFDSLEHVVDKGEIRSVLEGERFIDNAGLHGNTIAAGDVFDLDGHLFLNIRPDCDTIPRSAIESIDDIELYLLKGSKLTNAKEERQYNANYGNFDEQDNQTIVFSMLKGKSYDFRFKDLTTRKWSELKNVRIGCLLPPYITRIQQRYALYLQRQGMQRTPEKAIREATAAQLMPAGEPIPVAVVKIDGEKMRKKTKWDSIKNSIQRLLNLINFNNRN